ncbi:MAG: FAD-dependent oxidoreductase, partial [Bacteroidetes bacterium]
MNTEFDNIIWGPSLEGIQKSIELKQSGKEVLLAGKFGFPGGKATEALASLFPLDYFNEPGFKADFLKNIESLQYGVLFRNQQWVLMHPEAVKRVCWQMLNENNVQLLFHVLPLKVELGANPRLEVFGREGTFSLTAGEITDMSDDRYLDNLLNKEEKKSIIINSFFSDPLPADFPGFQVIRRFETPIGQYISVSVKNVVSGDVERAFNRELDRLSKESWKKHQARILMVPVYP